jgi:hypothetical protein
MWPTPTTYPQKGAPFRMGVDPRWIAIGRYTRVSRPRQAPSAVVALRLFRG